MKFENKVLMLGYGAVAKCTVPILLKHVKIPYRNITIIDFEDKADALKKWTDEMRKTISESEKKR
jgi:homospermidine synthase